MAKACACHILVKSLQEAEQLKQQLLKGANFAQLAKKNPEQLLKVMKKDLDKNMAMRKLWK